MSKICKFSISEFTITIFIYKNIRECDNGKKRCFLHFTFIPNYQSVLKRVTGQHIQFNYLRQSRESARKRPVLDDFLDTCKSFLVQAKVELLKVVVHMEQKYSGSKVRNAHQSIE